MKKLFCNFRNGITNLITWFPIIWNDRDWDYGYLLELIEFKAKRMLALFESDNTTDWTEEYSKKDLEGLKRFIVLIDNIHTEKYSDEAFEEHHKLFPSKLLEEWFEPRLPGENFIRMKPMSKEERKSFRSAWKVSEKNRKKVFKEIGEILVDHFQGWWN